MKKLEIIDISVLVREDPDNYVKEVPIIPIGGDIFYIVIRIFPD